MYIFIVISIVVVVGGVILLITNNNEYNKQAHDEKQLKVRKNGLKQNDSKSKKQKTRIV